MEVNVIHMAPRGLYLPFDPAALIPFHRDEASSSALFSPFPFLALQFRGMCQGEMMKGIGVGALQAVKPDGHSNVLMSAATCSFR